MHRGQGQHLTTKRLQRKHKHEWMEDVMKRGTSIAGCDNKGGPALKSLWCVHSENKDTQVWRAPVVVAVASSSARACLQFLAAVSYWRLCLAQFQVPHLWWWALRYWWLGMLRWWQGYLWLWWLLVQQW